MPENVILASVLERLGARPDCRLWRNNTGKLPDPRTGRWVSFGLKGSSDLIGVATGGRFIGIETKTAEGRLSADQRAFRDMILAFGGIYFVARNADEAEAKLNDALGRGDGRPQASVHAKPLAGDCKPPWPRHAGPSDGVPERVLGRSTRLHGK